MNQMLERAARAIREETTIFCCDERCCCGGDDKYECTLSTTPEALARAVITELLRPTCAMIEAAMKAASAQGVVLDEMSPSLFFGPVLTEAINAALTDTD